MITGGSSGIGLATASAVARRGASVSLIARNPERLAAAAEQLRGEGTEVRAAAADVSDRAALTGALDSLEPCDVLVTSAGQARPGRFLELGDRVARDLRLLGVRPGEVRGARRI